MLVGLVLFAVAASCVRSQQPAPITATVSPTYLFTSAAVPQASGGKRLAGVVKSVTLLNGALDAVVTINVTSTSITTEVHTYVGSGSTSGSTTRSIFTERAAASSTGYVAPAFTDEDGNRWTLFPGAVVSVVFRKADSKVRFQMHHAAVKSYYPVSEYSFEMPVNTVLCDGSPQSAGYKCCPAAGGATNVVYGLAAAVDPVTCTANATIEYLDHYAAVDGSTGVKELGDGSSGSVALLMVPWGSAVDVAKGIATVLVVNMSWGSQATVGVMRNGAAGYPQLVELQQLCRSSGFLSNKVAPEPFLVNNWAFGVSARQIGYTAAQYVADRQCNGAPLGYYSSYDGNNSDQFSAWRMRTPSFVLYPLTWRNDVTTTTAVINGITHTYAETFSMTTASIPVTWTAELNVTAWTASLRPAFRVLTLLLPLDVSGSWVVAVTAAVSGTVVLSHAVDVGAVTRWVFPTATLPPSNASLRSTCSLLSSSTEFFSNTQNVIASVSSTLPTRLVSFAEALPASVLTSLSSGGVFTCNYTLTQDPAEFRVVHASLSSRLAASMTISAAHLVGVSTPPLLLLQPLRAGTGATSMRNVFFLDTTLVSSLRASLLLQEHPPNTPAAVDGQPPPTVQCRGDTTRNEWIWACDAIDDTSCAARYPHHKRTAYDAASTWCVIPASSLSPSTEVLAPMMHDAVHAAVTLFTSSYVWQEALARTTASLSAPNTASPRWVVILPLWMALPVTEALSNVTFTHASPPAPVASAISPLLLAAQRLPFTAKAAVILFLLVFGGAAVALVAVLWVQWRRYLPWKADSAALRTCWVTNVWNRLPTRASLSAAAHRAVEHLRSAASHIKRNSSPRRVGKTERTAKKKSFVIMWFQSVKKRIFGSERDEKVSKRRRDPAARHGHRRRRKEEGDDCGDVGLRSNAEATNRPRSDILDVLGINSSHHSRHHDRIPSARRSSDKGSARAVASRRVALVEETQHSSGSLKLLQYHDVRGASHHDLHEPQSSDPNAPRHRHSRHHATVTVSPLMEEYLAAMVATAPVEDDDTHRTDRLSRSSVSPRGRHATSRDDRIVTLEQQVAQLSGTLNVSASSYGTLSAKGGSGAQERSRTVDASFGLTHDVPSSSLLHNSLPSRTSRLLQGEEPTEATRSAAVRLSQLPPLSRRSYSSPRVATRSAQGDDSRIQTHDAVFIDEFVVSASRRDVSEGRHDDRRHRKNQRSGSSRGRREGDGHRCPRGHSVNEDADRPQIYG